MQFEGPEREAEQKAEPQEQEDRKDPGSQAPGWHLPQARVLLLAGFSREAHEGWVDG